MNASEYLEYAKLILSTPVMALLGFAIVILNFRTDIRQLMARISKVKIAGGEIEASQLEKQRDAKDDSKTLPEVIQQTHAGASHSVQQLETALPPDASRQLLVAEEMKSVLWEFRFMNLYFVRRTQVVLDWFKSNGNPISRSLYEDIWMVDIPSALERNAVFTALSNHQLIEDKNGIIHLTAKGDGYLQWRGPLPPLLSSPVKE
jgi:hypothetical protein